MQGIIFFALSGTKNVYAGHKMIHIAKEIETMKKVIDIQKKLLPDLLTIIQKRFHILRYIGAMEPVGRRNLASSLGSTERVLRSEVDFLKQQNLLYSTSAGMGLTIEGKELLQDLRCVMREITGIDQMEQDLKRLLNIKKY